MFNIDVLTFYGCPYLKYNHMFNEGLQVKLSGNHKQND